MLIFMLEKYFNIIGSYMIKTKIRKENKHLSMYFQIL